MMYFAIASLCAYFIAMGIKEAVLWSRKATDAYKWNEHAIFVAERVILVLACISFFWMGIREAYLDLFATLIIAMFLFPFVHNGSYYSARGDIDGSYPRFPEGFKAEPSKTSTADWNFTYKQRLWLFVIGIVQLLGYTATKIF